MPDYRLRGAVRGADGEIGAPLVDETLTAADAKEAVRLANGRAQTIDIDAVNALWLVDGRAACSGPCAAPIGRLEGLRPGAARLPPDRWDCRNARRDVTRLDIGPRAGPHRRRDCLNMWHMTCVHGSSQRRRRAPP